MSAIKNIATKLRGARPALLASLTTSLAEDDGVVEAVDAVVGDSANFAKVLEALGVSDPQRALTLISELMGAKNTLVQVQSQLEEAMSMGAQVEAAVETQDVAAAMSAKGYSSNDQQLTRSLSTTRASFIATAIEKLPATGRGPKALSDARREGRKAFLAEFGVAPEGQERLLSTILATPAGAQLSPNPASIPRGTAPNTLLNQGGNGGAAPRQIDLTGVHGPNPTARLMSWVKAQPGNEKLTQDQAFDAAKALRRNQSVVIVGV
jgi:hypothetical protein